MPYTVPAVQVVPQADDQVSFQADGAERLRWHFAPRYPRPFFFPLIGPSGRSLSRMGHPAAYDYGVMRTNWMVHLVTNWMGDDAWVWTVSAHARKFNYLGDAHFVSGVVRDLDPTTNAVTIDVTGENQRGEVTSPGTAVVLLPSREDGGPRLPDPPATTALDVLRGEVERLAQTGDE